MRKLLEKQVVFKTACTPVYNRYEDILRRSNNVAFSAEEAFEAERVLSQDHFYDKQTNPSEESERKYIAMKEAAKILNVPYDKLSRLVRQKVIQTYTDILDQRIKLVELNEVKRIFKIQ